MALWPVPEPSMVWLISQAIVLGVTGALLLIGAAAVVGLVRADWMAARRRRERAVRQGSSDPGRAVTEAEALAKLALDVDEGNKIGQAFLASHPPDVGLRGRALTGQRCRMIPESEWRWFGAPGHLIVAIDCRFHLCTQIGDVLVSTVGEYIPDESARDIHCHVHGITLEGRGDARFADYMRKVGFQEIGYGRTYETMVFRTTGDVCHAPGCGCGLPRIAPGELDMRGYTTAGAATLGHMELCRQYASPSAADPGTLATRVDSSS